MNILPGKQAVYAAKPCKPLNELSLRGVRSRLTRLRNERVRLVGILASLAIVLSDTDLRRTFNYARMQEVDALIAECEERLEKYHEPSGT